MTVKFSSVWTASIVQNDPTFLKRIDAKLLDPVELAALEWAVEHHRLHGKMPSKAMVEDHKEFSLYKDPTFARDPLSSVFERAMTYLTTRYARRLISELDEGALLDGEIDIDRLAKESKFLSGLTAEQHTSLLDEEDDIYSLMSRSGAIFMGLEGIDTVLNGTFPGEFLIGAARPGVGKSWLGCWRATEWAREGKKVLAISCEMTRKQLKHRIHGILGGFNPRLFRKAETVEELVALRERVTPELLKIGNKGGNIIFPKRLDITPATIIGLITDLKPDAVFLDAIYLMHANDRKLGGWERVKAVAEEIKSITVDYEIPIFATTQFKRGTDDKGEGFDLEDLAFSDALAQVPDQVLAMSLDDTGGTRGIIIDILKNRQGDGIGSAKLTVDWDTMLFAEEKYVARKIKLGGSDDEL